MDLYQAVRFHLHAHAIGIHQGLAEAAGPGIQVSTSLRYVRHDVWLTPLFRHLTGGGYIEIHDPINPLVCDDGTVPAGSAIVRWNQLFLEASAKLGAPLDSARYYKQQLADAGFTHVTQIERRWPTNPWPRDKKDKEVGTSRRHFLSLMMKMEHC